VTESGAPARWWYLVAVLVALAGVAVAGFLVVRTISGAGEDLQRLVVPGEVEVLLDEPGTYTIYYEHRSVVDGRMFATAGTDVSALLVVVEEADTGEDVQLTAPRGNVEYEFGPHAGRAVFNFSVGDPGGYLVKARYPEGTQGAEVVLAVGQGVGRRIATGLLAGIGIPFVAFGLAVIIAVVTYVSRRRARPAE
jgi:hypothetical protein